MKKKLKIEKAFYLRLGVLVVISALIVSMMTAYVDKRIASLADTELQQNIGLLKFGVFINSYSAIERLSDYYATHRDNCFDTKRTLGIFLGYACKGHYGKAGLEKAKLYRVDFLLERKDCEGNMISNKDIDFSCNQNEQGDESDIYMSSLQEKLLL